MPYNPYGYQIPTYYGQPMPDQLAQLRQSAGYQPPMMGQPTPPSAPATPAIIWVPNSQAAENYLVSPNSAVVLWDSSAPVIYLKQADSSGKPSIKIYDLVERSTTPPSQSAIASQDDFSEMKKEIETVKAEIAELKEKIPSSDKSEK